MTHGHFEKCSLDQSCYCEVRRYWLVLAIVIVTFAAELAGGKLFGSLALLADAGHVLSDGSAVVVNILLFYLLRVAGNANRWRRVGGFINSLLLGGAAVSIFHESLDRLVDPKPVVGAGMMVVAVAGLIANYFQHQILEKASPEHRHLNHRVLTAHVLSDLLLSFAVVASGVAVMITGQSRIDPAVSLAASLLLGWWSVKFLRESLFGKHVHAHNHPHDSD